MEKGRNYIKVAVLVKLLLIGIVLVDGQTFEFPDEQYFVFEGETVDITMRRSTNTGVCTVAVSFLNGPPNLNNPPGMNDLTVASGYTFGFVNGDTASGGVTMTAVEDGIANEGMECFELAIENPAGNACINDLGDIATTSICVIDRTPLFYIEEAQYIVKERSDLVIRVRRAGYQHHITGTVSVDIDVRGMTATGGGTDFTEPIQTASFDAGIDWVERTIPITEDDIKEDIETFTIELINPVMGVIDQPAVSTAYIFDESAWVYIEKAQYVIGERDGTLTVRIRRGGYLWDDNDVSVDLLVTDGTATGGGTDFLSPVTGNAIFSPGDDSVDMEFTISEDTVVEDTERFTITLTNPSGAFLDEPSTSTVFIEDQTAWFYMEESSYIVGERSDTVTIRIHRGGYKDDDAIDSVDIFVQDITTTGNIDYVEPVTSRANFGMDVNHFDMTFTINEDNDDEDLESFAVTLQNPLGGVITSPQITTVFIVDESVWFYLEDSKCVVGEREGALSIRIRKGGYKSTTSTASVDLNIQDVTATGSTSVASGVDYTPTGVTTAVFPVGVEFVDIILNIISPDDDVEDVERFTVALQNPVGGFINTNEPTMTTVHILDETAWFYIEKDSYTIGERAGSMTIRIRRGGYLWDEDTLSVGLNIEDITTSLASDYSSPVAAGVAFSPGEDHAEVDITILSDEVIEDKESFTISLTNPQGGIIGTPDSTTVHIEDETAHFWIEEKQYIVNEGQTVEVVFHRGGYLREVDTLTLSSIDGTASVANDFALPDDVTITFPRGSTTSTKTLSIHHDNLLEHWEDFTLTATIATASGERGRLYSPITSTVFIRDPTWYNFDAPEYITWEDESTILIGVRREGDVRQAGSVEIHIEGGSATLNTDFNTAETPTAISFATGVRLVLVSLTILDDDDHEDDEVAIISFRNPTHGEALGSMNKAIVKILDNDEPIRPSVKWIIIATMGVILALLILAMVTLCLCYVRQLGRYRLKSQAVDKLQLSPIAPPIYDTDLSNGPSILPILDLPESVRYSYPALN